MGWGRRDRVLGPCAKTKDNPIRHAVTEPVLLALALLALAACGPQRAHEAGASAYKARTATGEGAYRRPPSLGGAMVEPGGRMRLMGQADPDARVRLASPLGQSIFARADTKGAWHLLLPPLGRLRLFGLSMVEGARSVQAEGYLAIGPGVAAQLRAGAGALTFAPAPSRLAITALDLDRKGAAVVSGWASPGSAVALQIDAKVAGQVAADAQGGYAFDLGEPLTSGPHQIRVHQGALSATVSADATPGGPPASGPYTATPAGAGWRIVWMPPGGGLQTTLLFGAGGNGG